MKSFFTFFDRTYGYSRAIISAILGTVMVIWPDSAVRTIIITIGAVLMLLGAITFIFSKRPDENTNRSILSINGVSSLIFGLVLVIFPSFFAGIIMFLFGAILLIIGLSETATLISARKENQVPFSLFIGPLLTTICGVVIFFNPFSTIEWLFIFFGAALLMYSLTEFISTRKLRKIYQSTAKSKGEGEDLIQDTEYEEVE